jgi:hypothetical protein
VEETRSRVKRVLPALWEYWVCAFAGSCLWDWPAFREQGFGTFRWDHFFAAAVGLIFFRLVGRRRSVTSLGLEETTTN